MAIDRTDSTSSAVASTEIDVIGLLAARWRLLMTVSLIGAALGTGVAFLLPKQYQAIAVLAPAVGQPQGGGLGSLLGQFTSITRAAPQFSLSGEASVDEHLAVATSRTFLEQFAGEQGITPVLFAADWDAVQQKWRVSSAQQPSAADAARLMQTEIMEIRSDRDTGLVQLSVTWTDPVLAAEWANEIVRRVNESARSRAIAEAETGLNYLRTQLGSTNEVQLRDSINALIEAQLQRIMLARVRSDYAFRIVDAAVAPEPEDFVSPRRVLVAVFGGIGALLLCFAWLLAVERLRESRDSPAPS